MMRRVINVCHKWCMETLTIIIATCIGLMIHVANTTQLPKIPIMYMSFNEMVVYDFLLYIMAILHSLIQFTRYTKQIKKIQHLIMVLINVGTYLLFSLICYTCAALTFIPHKMYVIRYGLPTFLFMFDWKKCVHVSKSLLQPSTEFSQHMVNSSSVLGLRLLSKTIARCMFFVLGIYSDVPELSQLSLLTCISVVINWLTFVTLLPALNTIQHNVQTGAYCFSTNNILYLLQDNNNSYDS